MRRALRAPLLCLLGMLLAAPSAAQAQITVNDVQASEGNGGATMTFTVTRSAGWFASGVTISYATADGSAVAPADYAAVSGTLSFGGMLFGGTDTRHVTIALAGDALNESAESFRLTIGGSSEVTDGEGIGTIIDDDPEPALTLLDAAPVGEGSGAAARFTMRLSKPSGREVSATFATANGTATAGQDYSARGGRLTIPAGATSVNLDVPILNDAADEPSETFELRISAPVAATIADGSATATIVDDDEPPAPPPAAGGGGNGGSGTPVPPPPPPTVGSSSAAPGLPRLGLSSPRLLRPATMLVTIACPQDSGGCRGRITIFTIPNRRSKVPALRKERRLGRATFTLSGGRSRTLRLTLGRTNRRLLHRVGRIDVRAYAVTENAAGRSGVRTVRGTLIARTLHSR